MADRRENTLAHSRNHVTDLSMEGGNLFKIAAKIKTERVWVRGFETGETNKMTVKANSYCSDAR